MRMGRVQTLSSRVFSNCFERVERWVDEGDYCCEFFCLRPSTRAQLGLTWPSTSLHISHPHLLNLFHLSEIMDTRFPNKGATYNLKPHPSAIHNSIYLVLTFILIENCDNKYKLDFTWQDLLELNNHSIIFCKDSIISTLSLGC